jgi:hypothetical protein
VHYALCTCTHPVLTTESMVTYAVCLVFQSLAVSRSSQNYMWAVINDFTSESVIGRAISIKGLSSVRFKVYNATVVPNALYGYQVWPASVSEINQLKTLQPHHWSASDNRCRGVHYAPAHIRFHPVLTTDSGIGSNHCD